MRTFTIFLIVFYGVQIFGYAIIDTIAFTTFIAILLTQNNPIKLKIDIVFIFCLYNFLQCLRGVFVIEDLRVLYWAYFFVVLWITYSIWVHNRSLRGLNFVYVVYSACFSYFILYGLLAIIFRNPDDYQGIFWIGSSSAFLVVVPFMIAHLLIAERNNYSKTTFFDIRIYAVIAVSVIHYSRVGLYLVIMHLLALLSRSLISSLRSFLLALVCIAASLAVWNQTKNFYYEGESAPIGSVERMQLTSVANGGVGTLRDTSNDLSRFVNIYSTYNKVTSSGIEFMFGSGYYTSRYTLKPFEKSALAEFGLKHRNLNTDRPMQLSGFASIISDTGIVGFILFMTLFVISAGQILRTKHKARWLIVLYMFLLFPILTVGNPLVSFLTYFIILPNGLVVRMVSESNYDG